jgi:GAF domain-containing protein
MTSRPPALPPPPIEGSGRLRGLLEAHRTITDDLSLTSVLDRVIRAACDLVGAEYGALGVIASDGSIEHFAHRGLDEQTVALIGALPKGRGLLGTEIGDPRVVRLSDLMNDPRYEGFPRRHPPMRSFIGVPIRVRGAAFGELYLADSAPNRFDADDEELVFALAATAGTAIQNARLYDEAQRSRDWLNASGEIARALLADADEAVLLNVVSRALSVAEADYACLILPTGDGNLRVTVAKGIGADEFRGHVFDPSASTLGKAILAAESIRTHDMTLWTDVDYDNHYNYGPAMIAPLVDAHGSRGAVLMMRTADRVPFIPHDVELASTFAAQVALALELNDTRAEAEWVRFLEDRHKIAQDLHDNVMQRLFAVGVGLQALAGQVTDPEIAERMARHIGDLDETIDEIRTRVFGLRDDTMSSPRRRRKRFPHVARYVAAAVMDDEGGSAPRPVPGRNPGESEPRARAGSAAETSVAVSGTAHDVVS